LYWLKESDEEREQQQLTTFSYHLSQLNDPDMREEKRAQVLLYEKREDEF
jgi:hypothetical protein